MVCAKHKVSVQGVGVVALGLFATSCQELDFHEAGSFIVNFQKEKANTVQLKVFKKS